VNEILARVPLDDLAGQLGASKKDTKDAASQAITSLLGGLHYNSQESDGVASLAKALLGHAGGAKAVSGGGKVDLGSIDTGDGAKIVKHALGTTPSRAATQLSAKTGAASPLLAKVLPVVAPLVLTYVANQALGASGGSILDLVKGSIGGSGSSKPTSGGGLGDLLGDVLGSALGTGKATPAPRASSTKEGSVLGSILGHLF